MDIKSELIQEHSKKQTLKITRYIGNDPKRFAVLVKLFFQGQYLITQRAAWALSLCSEVYPNLVKPYLKQLIENLKQPGLHDAVKRNTLRLLQDIDIPYHLTGSTADHCFKLLASKNEAVAVRVFSMSVLFNVCKKEPDLRNELKLLIEEQLPYASAAFRSRGEKILQAMKKDAFQ